MDDRMRWNLSDRRSRLPGNWARIRCIVRDRAHGRCQATVHAPGCNGIGTDCDHIVAGDDHSLDNLQWLSHACHKAKTERENAERNISRARMRRHPVERFPGLVDLDDTPVGVDSPGHRV